MTDTTDMLIAAGVVGAGYWYLTRRERELEDRTRQYLQDEAHASQALVPAPNPPSAVARTAASRPAPSPVAAPPPATQRAPRPMSATAPPAAPPAPAKTLPPRPNTTAMGPTQPIPRTYDSLFLGFAPTLPVSYLRALAAHESDMHPDAIQGAGCGLFSIVEIRRADFNARRGLRFSAGDLLNPVINIQIASDAIRQIIDSYAKNHPNVSNLHEDWSNARFVELVTFGWNAGFSERGGVGRVAGYLEQQGKTDITLDLVVATAKAAGASPALTDPSRVRYARDVTATYFRERGRDVADGLPTAPPTVPVASPSHPATPNHPTLTASDLADASPA